MWGANGCRVSQGRFRVVRCGAFRLGFDGGLGGEAENMSLFAPVVRQVLAQSQESCRRELDRLTGPVIASIALEQAIMVSPVGSP